MVEVDVQLLVGTAVTVFLALMFFGVVVLWDVALALRSVGDKVDKLEDSIDDNLTDIGHSLDGVSTGGGGTQLHLSGGGTISSAPGATQAQAPQQSQGQAQPQSGPARGQAQPQGSRAAGRPQAPHAQQSGEQPPQHPPSAENGSDEATEPDGDAAEDDAMEETEAVHEAAASDGVQDDASTPEETGPDVEDESEPTEETPTDPLVERNRDRFATPADRTPWYATPIDWAAVGEVQPEIAGELTDGSERTIDESEIIAAGPPESAPSDSTTELEEGRDDSSSDGDAATTSRTGRSGDDADAEDDGSDASTAGSNDAGDGATAATSTDESSDATGERGAITEEVEAITDETADESTTRTDDGGPADGAVLSYDETDDDAGDDAMDGRESDESNEQVSEDRSDDTPVADPGTDEPTDASEGDTDPDRESSSRPLDTDASGFDFEDVSEFDEERADVPVEEAVDTMNEDAPTPELSSHRFDVTAETDGDGAILTFEFDADTVDISGSTERLLTYQMRSYADQDSTPDGDVTIGQRRIVIEIPASDGTAVQQWGEAAVSIIDRTLYLSDNSGEE
ncbi:hypothetical protein ACFO5R_16705 [Halosolutus amylolyticus]|uniref:ATPase AAA n=1 Tax=Halosolutus amylolyticus TaxID=2932267 RepID=A0ABD5PUE4_9EURY|nr:hypothetical protein [Halosolutus amylolyticus]